MKYAIVCGDSGDSGLQELPTKDRDSIERLGQDILGQIIASDMMAVIVCQDRSCAKQSADILAATLKTSGVTIMKQGVLLALSNNDTGPGDYESWAGRVVEQIRYHLLPSIVEPSPNLVIIVANWWLTPFLSPAFGVDEILLDDADPCQGDFELGDGVLIDDDWGSGIWL
ncbi:hypothetical protein FWF48_03270 [Candidatus Saccharibacteria bacterium]|nr:hypothetical protein [Candidatus Saccharibacteria bacterium]